MGLIRNYLAAGAPRPPADTSAKYSGEVRVRTGDGRIEAVLDTPAQLLLAQGAVGEPADVARSLAAARMPDLADLVGALPMRVAAARLGPLQASAEMRALQRSALQGIEEAALAARVPVLLVASTAGPGLSASEHAAFWKRAGFDFAGTADGASIYRGAF